MMFWMLTKLGGTSCSLARSLRIAHDVLVCAWTLFRGWMIVCWDGICFDYSVLVGLSYYCMVDPLEKFKQVRPLCTCLCDVCMEECIILVEGTRPGPRHISFNTLCVDGHVVWILRDAPGWIVFRKFGRVVKAGTWGDEFAKESKAPSGKCPCCKVRSLASAISASFTSCILPSCMQLSHSYQLTRFVTSGVIGFNNWETCSFQHERSFWGHT